VVVGQFKLTHYQFKDALPDHNESSVFANVSG